MGTDKQIWKPDVLGPGFEMTYVQQPDDYSGKVRCTVVRRCADAPSNRAILYVHGFSDYFFHKEMAEMFAGNGYNFYAVDLRKYGRSLLPGQRMFQVRDIYEYFADIDAAIGIIGSDGNSEAVLLGHSTGGLTTSLYMTEAPSPMIKALMLNSPFLAWNMPPLIRDVAIPAVGMLGRFMPNVHVHQKADRGYAESLSQEYGGEWSCRKDWKPDVMPDPDMGWVRAIDKAQKELRKRKIGVPVLLMHSAASVRKGDGPEKYRGADAILDVKSISKYGRLFGPDVTEVNFEGGLHDLALSRKDVRAKMYEVMLGWLREERV